MCVTAIDGVGFTITVGVAAVVGEMEGFIDDTDVVCVVNVLVVEH